MEILKQLLFMLVNGTINKEMEQVFNIIQMEVFMKVTGWIIINMVMVEWYMMMVIIILENGRMVNCMVKVS